jgi:hypothetical protein
MNLEKREMHFLNLENPKSSLRGIILGAYPDPHNSPLILFAD